MSHGTGNHWTTGGGGKKAQDAVAKTGIHFPLIVEHIATGEAIIIPTLKLESFSDTVTPKWNKEAVFGRMDEIATYQGTTRKISMKFKLGESVISEAKVHYQMIRKLMEFQYPVYLNRSNALTLAKPPLLNIKYANLISAKNTNGPLICILDSLSFAPILGSDIQQLPYVSLMDGDGKEMESELYPKGYNVSLDITVLHDEPLGTSVMRLADRLGESDSGVFPNTGESDSGVFPAEDEARKEEVTSSLT
jgi:hypothetical protein